MSTPFAMSIKTAAAYLDVDEKTIRFAIDHEHLTARRIGPKGGRWSIETDDLINWYRGLPQDVRDTPGYWAPYR